MGYLRPGGRQPTGTGPPSDPNGMTLQDQWQRWRWNARRFGMTPGKFFERLGRRGLPRVLTVSLPKAGTHLLEVALCRAPGLRRAILPTLHDANIAERGDLEPVLAGMAAGEIAVTHLSHSEARAEAMRRHAARTLFLVRDPRDIVVSQAHYALERREHPQHEVFRRAGSLRERVLVAIRGNAATGLDAVGLRLAKYAPWLEEDDVLTVHFEDLVGEAGGGTSERQRATLAAVFEHLGLALAPATIDDLAAAVFSPASPTFRRGTAGGWREVFDDELTDAFRQEAGGELTRYGYGWERAGSGDTPNP
jgi:hypothetical protein